MTALHFINIHVSAVYITNNEKAKKQGHNDNYTSIH